MKKIFLYILSISVLMPIFAQNSMTLDDAINDYATGLINNIQRDRGVAVIAFETEKHELMEYFIDTMTEKLWQNNIRQIFERRQLEVLQKELDYSLSGDVSDETALRIGKRTGVNTVIYGFLRRIGNNYMISIRATNVETGQLIFPKSYDLEMNSRLAGLLGLSETAWADDIRQAAGQYQQNSNQNNASQSSKNQSANDSNNRQNISSEPNIFNKYFSYSLSYAYRNNLYVYQPMTILWDDSEDGLGFEFINPIGITYSPIPFTSIGISFIIMSIFSSESIFSSDFYFGANTNLGIVLPVIGSDYLSFKLFSDFLLDFGVGGSSLWNIKETIGVRPGFDIGILLSLLNENTLFLELKYQGKWYLNNWYVQGLSFAIGYSFGDNLKWW